MLASARWSNLGEQWDENTRQKLNLVWHHLDGIFAQHALLYAEVKFDRGYVGWPDASKGLHGMKKKKLAVALSNGNIRLLADMVRAMNHKRGEYSLTCRGLVSRRNTPISRGM